MGLQGIQGSQYQNMAWYKVILVLILQTTILIALHVLCASWAPAAAHVYPLYGFQALPMPVEHNLQQDILQCS